MPPESTQQGPAVYALTPRGAELGRLLAKELKGTLHLPGRLMPSSGHEQAQPFDSLPREVARQFHKRPAHVFITAAGVAVRMISPHLQGKDKDPAVIVLDQDGRFCVSLLAGHLGGANSLAEKVASITRGRAVVTTATDTMGAAAIDILALEAGLTIGDISRAKQVNAALAAGEQVPLRDTEGWLPLQEMEQHFIPASTAIQASVVVDRHVPDPAHQGLWLYPPALCLGVGCRRGVSSEVLLEHIHGLFEEHNLALASLWAMGSVQAKKDEPGLHQAAAVLGVPLRFFPAPVLDAVRTPNPSPRAAKAVGTSSVCEAAALLLAGSRELLLEKQSLGDTTLALALRRPG